VGQYAASLGGAGEAGLGGVATLTCEGYGPGGVAVVIEATTDNRARTIAEIREAFARNGGNLGAQGSVAYLFNRVGHLVFPQGLDEELLAARAIEAGAEDVLAGGDGAIEVLTAPGDCMGVCEALQASGFTPVTAKVTLRAATPVRVAGGDAARLVECLAALECLAEVRHVYSNARFPYVGRVGR
jgi:transcriptional/translational regulatory protein YebC/TACO1